MLSAKWTHRLLATAFVLALLLPMIAMLKPSLAPEAPLLENRALAERPDLAGLNDPGYPTQYEAYFSDNFGLRKTLIRHNNLIRYKLFNVSATKEVIAGQDGWLFYTGAGKANGIPAANHQGDLNEFGEKFLGRMTRRLEGLRDHFADHGIEYMLVVAPDKWSIYPEFLPAAYQAGDVPTCVDQFVRHLQANTTVRVLDLRHCLLAAKGQQWPIYLKADTHWSELGAFTGANEILTTLAVDYPAITPLDQADYNFETVPATIDGLAYMLGIKGLLAEQTFRITPREPTNVLLSTELAIKPALLNARQDNPALPRAIMLRDSFAHAIVPFLSTGFSEIEYVWTAKAREIGLAPVLRRIKPDMVIEMKVERYMLHTNKYYRPNREDFAPIPPE